MKDKKKDEGELGRFTDYVSTTSYSTSRNQSCLVLPTKVKGMESLSETTWDVLISGTGLQQSLLALWVSILAPLTRAKEVEMDVSD
jgi:hypothetical protein